MNAGGLVLGVDFGTSNTAATLRWPDGRVRAVLFDGSPLLPSAACVEGDAILVGTDALQAARANPGGAELHPKQRIDDGTVLLAGAEYPVVDLIGAVLRRVVQEATRIAGQAPARLVLAHPASWGPHRRERLLAAAAAAGVPQCDLVVEPVAAASHFVGAAGSGLAVGARALIYDLGAGTFDASVVRRTADGFEVLSTEGLIGSGGLDLDAAIVAHLTAVFGGRGGGRWRRLVEPESDQDRRLSRQLWHDVRLAKEALSRRTSARITLPLLDEDAPLGREQLDALARPLLERTVAACRAALATAGVAPAELSGIYLVGGASRYPLVSTLLHQALGVAPTAIEQPELAVAEGAVRPLAGPAALSSGAPPAPADRRRPWFSRRGTVLAAGLAVVVISAGAGLAMRSAGAGNAGSPEIPGSAAASPAPSSPGSPVPTPTPTPSLSVAAGVDTCLVGQWRLISYLEPGVNLFGTKVDLGLVGTGYDVYYLADATGWTDNHKEMVIGGKAAGRTYRVTHTGTLWWTYRTINSSRITHTPKRAKGTTTWQVNGSVRATEPLAQDTTGGVAWDYECAGDELTFVDANSQTVFKKIGPPRPQPR